MPGWLELASGILLPALICCGILAAARRAGDRAQSAAAGLAFGLAWFTGYVAWSGLPAWPSADTIPPARDWLAWVVLLAGSAWLLVACGIPARLLALLSRPVFSAALAGLSLRSVAERSGSHTIPALVALAIFVVWFVADRWIQSADGPRAPLVLFVAALGTSLASRLAHSSLIAALAGALAACLAATTLLAVVAPRFRLRSGASAVCVLVLCGCLLNDVFFATLPRSCALLLVGSVLAPALLDLSRPGARGADGFRGGSWWDALLAAGLALVPAAIAVGLAWTPGGLGFE